ncbi:two pore calcium channel protein 1 isoform X3 [Populus trichocarpa]|uniref:two pore calcium channel protein 1 isoform X3 n=1 Tax=Populus trichocarpa TaxID=3694 RepID=UPI0022789DD4|nr:two pore calcium channel protein 1 isoform X3 [Populus trichocarpa]
MEKPLLGESSGGRDIRFRRRDQSTPKFPRRSDAITHGSPFQKAAALVDLAEDGIGIPEEILDQANFESVAKFYFIFIQFDIIWTLNYFAMIVLNFLEKPLWCQNNSGHSCNDREYFYLGELPYLTAAESFVFEGITLIILAAHIFFPISYEGFRIYWKNPLNCSKVICLCILVVDLVAYAIYASPVAFNFLPFRIAPYIRVVLFILYIRDLQRSIIILGGMLKTYVNVLALGFLFLLFSSWLAFVMFEDTQQGKIVFTSYGITLYQMFVLFTTSNNPDVWIPAYKVSRWYSLFFILYVLIGVYFVTNLVLAVVYDSFKDQLVKQVSEMDRSRKRILIKAFNLIDKNDAGFLNKEQCIHLFEALNKYRTLPSISREEFELIFDELDDSHDFKINLDEFEDLCNAIALRFQKEDVPSYFEYLPSIYHSLFSEKLKEFVRSPKFGYIISSILVMNLLAVITETTLDIANNSAQKVWQEVEFVFVIGETVTFASPNELTFLSNGEWIRYLLIARLLRLIRILMYVRSYRAFVATFLTLIPSLMPYLGTIFCVMCIYCSLGIQIFGGLVNAGNLDLEGTGLAEDDYLLFNFNDYPNGMVTLFNLLVMGNWHEWMQSYKDLTGTYWSLAYFISFYLVTVLLLLNLVMAFVLEGFFAEMELETAEKCEAEDKEGSNSKSRRRSVGTKTRSQRVDNLLHHMLSAELEKPECSNA